MLPDFTCFLVPTAEHWDFSPTWAALRDLCEALERGGWTRGFRHACAWDEEGRVLERGFEPGGALDLSRVEASDSLVIDLPASPVVGEGRLQRLGPGVSSSVTIRRSRYLVPFPSLTGRAHVPVPCPACSAPLLVLTETLWPGQLGQRLGVGRGLPRHCVSCGEATAPGELWTTEGGQPAHRSPRSAPQAPFYRVAVELFLAREPEVMPLEVEPARLGELSEALGVPLRTWGEVYD